MDERGVLDARDGADEFEFRFAYSVGGVVGLGAEVWAVVVLDALGKGAVDGGAVGAANVPTEMAMTTSSMSLA